MSGAEIWALTDGRAGNVAQAMGLAEALARHAPVVPVDKRVVLTRWAAAVPPALSHRLGARAGGWPFSGLAEGMTGLLPPWPRAVIGAGRRVAPLVAALGRVHGLATVQLLDPQMPASAFDAVVVPAHDDLSGPNVLRTVGALNRLTPDAIAAAAALWPGPAAVPGRPRLAVLVGGPSRSARFGESDGCALLLALETLSQAYALAVTTSRRTDPALAAALRARLGEAHVWTGEGDGPNPYPALLAGAAGVLVTEDSVNMASEAASCGVPVHVFPITSVAGKIARFHESLAAHGASRRFTGEIGHWSYAPLHEADRVAQDLLGREIV